MINPMIFLMILLLYSLPHNNNLQILIAFIICVTLRIHWLLIIIFNNYLLIIYNINIIINRCISILLNFYINVFFDILYMHFESYFLNLWKTTQFIIMFFFVSFFINFILINYFNNDTIFVSIIISLFNIFIMHKIFDFFGFDKIEKNYKHKLLFSCSPY